MSRSDFMMDSAKHGLLIQRLLCNRGSAARAHCMYPWALRNPQE